MKSRKVIIFSIILLLCCVIACLFHFGERDEVKENQLKIIYKDNEIYIDIDQLDYQFVSGTRINGKGEEKKVEGDGIALKAIFDEQNIVDYSSVDITSNDSYYASVTKDEVEQDHKVYLLLEEDLRLIVFGDQNSKRSVSNVVLIEIK